MESQTKIKDEGAIREKRIKGNKNPKVITSKLRIDEKFN